MKERPILFKAEMVRAILDGSKTQTRRIVKPQLDLGHWQWWQEFKNEPVATFCRCGEDYPDDDSDIVKCPYGQEGDRLWVRETFRLFDGAVECGCSEAPCNCPGTDTPLYRADYDNGESRWKPSIFMPRRVSRITLEITNIRVERLNDICGEDAISEGIDAPASRRMASYRRCRAIEKFSILWESINGKDSWAENPWVWVVEFKRIDQEGGP